MNTERTKEKLKPLREAIQDYYSSPKLDNDRLARLLSLQNKYIKQKEDQILWGPLVACAFLGILLVHNIYKSNAIEVGLQSNFSVIVTQAVSSYLASVEHDNRVSGGTREFNDAIERYQASLDVAESGRVLPLPLIMESSQWELISKATSEDGAIIYNFYDRKVDQHLTMVVADARPDEPQLPHPVHTFRDNVNVRLWMKEGKTYAIAGNKIDYALTQPGSVPATQNGGSFLATSF